MGQTLVRLEKAHEKIVRGLLDSGLYKTKSEAIRAGILELGKQYRLVGFYEGMEIKQVIDPKIIRKLQKVPKADKGKFETLAEVNKKYGFAPETR